MKWAFFEEKCLMSVIVSPFIWWSNAALLPLLH